MKRWKVKYSLRNWNIMLENQNEAPESQIFSQELEYYAGKPNELPGSQIFSQELEYYAGKPK